MLKYALTLFTVFALTACDETRRQRQDPFASLDYQLGQSLAHHYLWPWRQLIQAAVALDLEESLEEPKIISDANKLEINIFAKRFKPNELRVRVKNHYIIIEGRHKEDGNDKRFMANRFDQRFALPRGSSPEEVTAVYKENGVLTVSVPRHELPPEREVPIEVRLPEPTTERPQEITTPKPELPQETSASSIPTKEELTSTTSPIEQLDLTEATTHVGKIRKKELKSSTSKNTKDNEVNKVDGNGLDALIEAEE